MRIFPEMWARTLWPFSSSTRNMALGRGSMTVPSSTIASSLGFGRGYSSYCSACRGSGATGQPKGRQEPTEYASAPGHRGKLRALALRRGLPAVAHRWRTPLATVAEFVRFGRCDVDRHEPVA